MEVLNGDKPWLGGTPACNESLAHTPADIEGHNRVDVGLKLACRSGTQIHAKGRSMVPGRHDI